MDMGNSVVTAWDWSRDWREVEKGIARDKY